MTSVIENNNPVRSHYQIIFHCLETGSCAIRITAEVVSATKPETAASEMVKIIENVGGQI